MMVREGAPALQFDRSRRPPQSPRNAAVHSIFQYGFKMAFGVRRGINYAS
jgi:hypothetical protein